MGLKKYKFEKIPSYGNIPVMYKWFKSDTDAIDYDGITNGIIRGNRIYNFYFDNSDGIDLGEGSLLESGLNQDVVIRVEANHTAVAKGNSMVGIPAPLGVIVATAEVGGTIEVFLGGTINHNGDLTLELHTANEAIAEGYALSIGGVPPVPLPVGGVGVSTTATVNPTISTYIKENSNIIVQGDFGATYYKAGCSLAENDNRRAYSALFNYGRGRRAVA